jgi:hypothetical protein
MSIVLMTVDRSVLNIKRLIIINNYEYRTAKTDSFRY